MIFHICPLDRTCRSVGAPWRITVGGERWRLGVAFRRRDRYARNYDPTDRTYTVHWLQWWRQR